MQSNELMSWVAWEELSRIPQITTAYDIVLKQLTFCQKDLPDVKVFYVFNCEMFLGGEVYGSQEGK